MARTAARVEGPRPLTVRGTRPNLEVANRYHAKLTALLKRMHREVKAAVVGLYKRSEPTTDAPSPLDELREILDELGVKWAARYERMSEAIASEFIRNGRRSSLRQLAASLRDVGFSVRVSASPRVREIIRQALAENVSLIKTIPGEYFRRIGEAVSESFYKGRDLGGLERALLDAYGISDRRARLISKDQNNKATQALSRANAEEAGITRGIWQHMRASTKPRPSHELMDGKEYDLAEGCFDPDVGRHIQPGELIMCNCECRWVIPGANNEFAHKNSLSKEARARL